MEPDIEPCRAGTAVPSHQDRERLFHPAPSPRAQLSRGPSATRKKVKEAPERAPLELFPIEKAEKKTKKKGGKKKKGGGDKK